jgi:hypothetical protein
MPLLETQRHYRRVFNKWWSQYRGVKPGAPIVAAL